MHGMQQQEIPNFLQYTTEKLLEEFGGGKHKPGSGSAAALLGWIACRMMRTVIIVTGRNTNYRNSMSELGFIDSIISDKAEPFFKEAVQKDAEQFHLFFIARGQRKLAEQSEPDEKARLKRVELDELERATAIPLEIAEHAAAVARRGLQVFDLGARHVRGDSSVAVSSAIASCSSALSIAYLNFTALKDRKWTRDNRPRAEVLTNGMFELQSELLQRVTRLQREGVPDNQPELGLNFD